MKSTSVRHQNPFCTEPTYFYGRYARAWNKLVVVERGLAACQAKSTLARGIDDVLLA